jgi:succinate-semialdehyde dehydrogenase/glutarate-semialdehyde dehydrogenase
MSDGLLAIGGTWRPADRGRTYDVVSPVTGAKVATLGRAGFVDVEAAVAAAVTAFEAHRQESNFGRAAWAHRIADVIDSRASELAHLMTLEHGKPLEQSVAELTLAAHGFRLAAEEAKRLRGETIPVEDPHKLVMTTRKPRGVFAVITPFNFPANIPVEYLGPLLACGNAVVWRPAPSTSVIARELYRCVEEADVPFGLINLVTGPDVEPAQLLTSHPDVIGVCFTGSTQTGRAIAERATGKTQLMELGGNGPIVVLADADLETASPAIAASAFWNSGQSCSAAGRIIAARTVADELVERLVDLATGEVVGSPFDASTTMGPVHTEGVAAAMSRHVGDAVARGGTVAYGGAAITDQPTGLYWMPTVLTGLDASSAVMREETFGPIAPVLRVDDDVESIIAAANSGEHGLSSAVFGRNLERTLAVAGRLKTGQVTVNDTSNYWELHLPFGGAPGRSSGQGRLGGRYIAEAVTELQSVSVHLASDWR